MNLNFQPERIRGKLKPGDKVHISIDMQYENVAPEMLHWNGQWVTIVYFSSYAADSQGNAYRIKEDGETWAWCDHMFDKVLSKSSDKAILYQKQPSLPDI